MIEGTDARLLEAVIDFVDRLELVFHHDWDFTLNRIAEDTDAYIRRDGGTFLDPQIGDADDESNNWGNRGSLLASYRQLCALMGRPHAHRD